MQISPGVGERYLRVSIAPETGFSFYRNIIRGETT